MENTISEIYRGFEIILSASQRQDGRWSVTSVIRPVTPEAIAASPRDSFGTETVLQGPMETGIKEEMEDARHLVDVLVDPIDLSS